MRLHHGQNLLILLLILLLKRLNLPLAVELQTLNMLPQQPWDVKSPHTGLLKRFLLSWTVLYRSGLCDGRQHTKQHW